MVKLTAVSLHRVSSFMSSVGLVVNRHYARQVDDQTLDLLLSAGPLLHNTVTLGAPMPCKCGHVLCSSPSYPTVFVRDGGSP